jgi:hypothetical protein
MLNVLVEGSKSKYNTIALKKRDLVKTEWFQKKFKPLFKKHLKGYRFLGAFVEKSKGSLYYDFRFDTPKNDELNLEIDKQTGDIVHVTMNGNVNLLSKEDLEKGHISDFAEVVLTFKNHVERKDRRVTISAKEMKALIKEMASDDRDEYLDTLKNVLNTLEQNQDNLADILEVEADGKVKRDDVGLPIIKGA